MVAPGLVDRYVNVYLPSKDDKQRWEAAAKEKGLTLSKFIFGTVEAAYQVRKRRHGLNWFRSFPISRRKSKSLVANSK